MFLFVLVSFFFSSASGEPNEIQLLHAFTNSPPFIFSFVSVVVAISVHSNSEVFLLPGLALVVALLLALSAALALVLALALPLLLVFLLDLQ